MVEAGSESGPQSARRLDRTHFAVVGGHGCATRSYFTRDDVVETAMASWQSFVALDSFDPMRLTRVVEAIGQSRSTLTWQGLAQSSDCFVGHQDWRH